MAKKNTSTATLTRDDLLEAITDSALAEHIWNQAADFEDFDSEGNVVVKPSTDPLFRGFYLANGLSRFDTEPVIVASQLGDYLVQVGRALGGK